MFAFLQVIISRYGAKMSLSEKSSTLQWKHLRREINSIVKRIKKNLGRKLKEDSSDYLGKLREGTKEDRVHGPGNFMISTQKLFFCTIFNLYLVTHFLILTILF